MFTLEPLAVLDTSGVGAKQVQTAIETFSSCGSKIKKFKAWNKTSWARHLIYRNITLHALFLFCYCE